MNVNTTDATTCEDQKLPARLLLGVPVFGDSLDFTFLHFQLAATGKRSLLGKTRFMHKND